MSTNANSVNNGSRRETAERVLRAIGLGALLLATALSTWRVLRPEIGSAASAIAVRVDQGNGDSTRAMGWMLTRAIVEQVAQAAQGPDSARVSVAATMAVVPGLPVRAMLETGAKAGIQMAWLDSTAVRDLAVQATAVPSPAGGTLVTAMARTWGDSAKRTTLTLQDAGGRLDSAAGATTSLRLHALRLVDSVRAHVSHGGRVLAEAHIAVPKPALVRGVRVFAAVGWEAKFVMAALEETGWTVSGTVTVAPRAVVESGPVGLLDTVRHSVAVVLDSGVVSAGTLRRFLAQGGGVVLAGSALMDAPLMALTSVRRAGARVPIPGALLTDSPRRGLAARLVREPSEAVVLERSGASPVVTVERHGVGRLLVNGYQSTWRWRMEGDDSGLAGHRAWWSALVSAVAFLPGSGSTAPATAPATASATESATSVPSGASVTLPPFDELTRDARLPGDAAPMADLRARLGSPVLAFAGNPRAPSRAPFALWVLFLIAAAALLSEWAMRRTRGAP